VKLGVRALEKPGDRARGPAAAPHPLLNTLLLRFARTEQAPVGRLGLPLGSSLLAWWPTK
jgi:hypothetical protein